MTLLATASTPHAPDAPEIGRLVARAADAAAPDRERHRAFGEIVARFQDLAYGCAYAYLRDFALAEDAAQDAFVAAWREIDDLRDPQAFPAWFKRIVWTQCNRMTRNKRLPLVPLDATGDLAAGDAFNPQALLEKREMRQAVRAAIESLPPHERLATTLFYVGEYGQSEIAAFLGVPVTTVKKRLYSARQRLKERMLPLAMVQDTLHENRPSKDRRFARLVRLWTALDRNDVASAATVLAEDSALAVARDDAGGTPLHRAARHGYEEIAALLLARGADARGADASGATPLHALAGGAARVDLAERLLAAGADPAARDARGETPLRVAARATFAGGEGDADYWGFAEYLLARGAPPDLFVAAALDRHAEAAALLASDPSLAAASYADDGATPLHWAARAGYKKVAKVLLDAGADKNARDARGNTPLGAAAAQQWRGPGTRRPPTPAVQLLLDAGADCDLFAAAALGLRERADALLDAAPGRIDARDADGATPLCLAAWNGHRDVVARLLERGADVHAHDGAGRTALSVRCAAAADYDREIAGLLLAHGAQPDLRAALVLGRTGDVARLLADDPSLADEDTRDWALEQIGEGEAIRPLLASIASTADLFDAVALRAPDAVARRLAERPDDVHRRRGASRHTPLHRAAARGEAAVADLLLAYGAAVDARSRTGETPLHVAARGGKGVIVERLLARGADPDARDWHGRTPLLAAAARGEGEDPGPVAERLLRAGANPDLAAGGRETPLHAAAERGAAAVVGLLLDHGADVGARNYWGGSALHLAAREGRAVVTERLTEAGADPDGRDDWHRTPLHLAAWCGHADAAERLLAHGADVEARNGCCSTPLHMAAERGNADVVALLLRRGADPNARSDYGRTPLHEAAQEGHGEVAQMLLAHGARVDQPNGRGVTPLHWAAASGRAEMVSLLLAHGADPAVRNERGNTPLDSALRYERADVVRLLRVGAARGSAGVVG